jgi:hypothetical protein
MRLKALLFSRPGPDIGRQAPVAHAQRPPCRSGAACFLRRKSPQPLLRIGHAGAALAARG